MGTGTLPWKPEKDTVNWFNTCKMVVSSSFNIKRGYCQGDLPPYSFLLCVESLGQMIRQNKEITGMIIHEIEHRLSQYADDAQLIAESN